MRRLAVIVALATAVPSAPAAAQPTCVAAFGSDYAALGSGGCEWGGVVYADFYIPGNPTSYISPQSRGGVYGFLLQSLGGNFLLGSSAGATPGQNFADFEGITFFYRPVGIASGSLVADPYFLNGHAAMADPGWRAFTRATIWGDGSTMDLGMQADGAPGVERCRRDLTPVACDMAELRIPYAGGQIVLDVVANVTALPAPASGSAYAQAVGMFVGLAPVSTVPEPGTWLLSGTGVVAIAVGRRRRRA